MNKKVLFIDRDGTLINEPLDNCQVDHIDKLILENDVIPALLSLQKIGFKLVMVTNQDGLGTPSFPKNNFYGPHNLMMKIFDSQGVIFDDVLICPHFLSDQCNCRKPQTLLVDSWLQENVLNKSCSYVIGDRETDMLFAKNMGINGFKYNRKTLNWKNISDKLSNLNRYSCTIRTTKETTVNVKIWLDQEGNSKINTGINFFDHMLYQIVIHSGIRVIITVVGDLHIDDHHTIEDTALAFGQGLKEALGDKCGIGRFGFVLPMDESLARCIIDISNRPYLKYKAKYNYQKIGDFSTEMVEHFFRSLSYSMCCTLHLYVKGKNDHHKVESLFKVFGQALRQAIRIKGNMILSSKGAL